jgi:hypothetical protein
MTRRPDDPLTPRAGRKEPLAGGAPLALSIIIGVVAGGVAGQPTIGLLAGLGVGIAIAIAIWWSGRDR